MIYIKFTLFEKPNIENNLNNGWKKVQAIIYLAVIISCSIEFILISFLNEKGFVVKLVNIISPLMPLLINYWPPIALAIVESWNIFKKINFSELIFKLIP